MKISNRSHPILEKLHKGSLGVMPIFEQDKLFFDLNMSKFVKNWKFYNEGFNQETNVISLPFIEASKKAEKNLIQLWQDFTHNDTSDFEVKGVYLYADFVCMIDYDIKRGSENNELSFFLFDKKGIPLAFYIDSSKYKVYQNGWISSCFELKNNEDELKNWIFTKIKDIVIFKMFKTYAEVETKIIPPNSKVKDINCKYVNDTELKLTYLDSKWFTNLVKSDAFKVSGHFRLQPKKKDGQWTKELIWINDFQKEGYTAPARKLNNINN